MEFGKLEIVDKTFSRVVNNPRGQNYNGIKFRRWVSDKEGKKGEIEEQFTISEKLFEALKLEDYALTQANTEQDVLILVVEDQDEVKPVAKFMRRSKKKDGTPQAKGRFISNTFLTEALVTRKVLDGETMENQYLDLVDVSGNFPDKPTQVKGIYRVVLDTTPIEEEKEEETAEATSAAPVKDEF